MLRKSSMPYSLLKEVFDSPQFNCDNCPICGQELEKNSGGPFVIEKCKNRCYRFSKFKGIRQIPYCINIFDYSYIFNIRLEKIKHYRYNYIGTVMANKRVENLIEYYKSNDRYVMKIMLRS